MRCPNCGNPVLEKKVEQIGINTKPGVYRVCLKCGFKMKTTEKP